jgi:hypothetical protein
LTNGKWKHRTSVHLKTSTAMADTISAIDLVSSDDDTTTSLLRTTPSKTKVYKKTTQLTKKRVPSFHPSTVLEIGEDRVQFSIAGSPLPLRRQRFGKKSKCYNPSTQGLKDFRTAVRETLQGIDSSDLPTTPLDAWSVSNDFILGCPNSHFVGN